MASLPFEWKFTEVLSYLLLCYLPYIDFVHGQYRLTPKNTIGVEGQSAMLHCAIRGTSGVVVWNHLVTGKPTLQLSIGGQLDLKLGVDRSRRIQVVGNRGRGEYHLRIQDVRMSDAGRFECMALVGLTRIVKRSAAFKVVRPPKPGYPVCQMEPAFGLLPGMEVKFACDTMGGEPKAQVRWWVGKKTLTPPKEGHIEHTHTLTARDYGQKFVCQEITPAYKTPRTCEVTPLEIDLRIDLHPAPQIEVRPGDDVTFTCYGQGTASFEFTWRLNDQALPFSKNIRTFGPNGSKLRISGITAANNNAKVTCVLTNIHGFSIKATSVIAVNIPRPRPKPKPKPKPTTKVQVHTPFVPRVPGAYPGRGPTLAPDATRPMGDYEVQYESELGADWGLDPPGGAMSSPAMPAMAAALVGILVGVIAAVVLILTRKYMNSNN